MSHSANSPGSSSRRVSCGSTQSGSFIASTYATSTYAACFENALLRVARERKTPIKESSVTARVGIGREDDGYFRLSVDLQVSVPGRDKAEVEEMVRIAHEEVCPYSRATRGNIDVNLDVV